VLPQSCPMGGKKKQKKKKKQSMGYLITSLNICFWGEKKRKIRFCDLLFSNG
jgi:hypothetical protein